ncbi:PREDICTED: sentrin-specific protease 1-like [Dufourea novaeangliae]|uniref:Sentrin-specific protease 1 n=1 Tax=Dufourea novaeangliae TaxID=178035 RepID=A0A154P1Z0_DUFNO|nr:PREDICTED: sentrin-specific protease 1-like [Dufourea novaeangliae]KZC05881.1 Sentrin-specific protease 1 [Dufourea novaeangliae]
MLLFNLLKRLFGWTDEAPRKRRAVSFSLEKEFVTPKKHCCDYNTVNVDEEIIEINEDSDSENVQIIKKHKHSPIKSSSRLNGTRSSRDKSFTCCSPSFSSSKSQQCYDDLKMGYFSSENERVQNIGAHERCPTLSKTHRLKEKNQYQEMLQNFLPRRIHVICDKHEEKGSVPEVQEVIGLEKSESSTSSSKLQQVSRKKSMSQMHWNMPNKERRNKETVVITLDNDKNNETVHSVCNIAQFTKRNSLEKSTPDKHIECVATNTLRDQLAAKAVIREDFVPRVAKRYNERIEQRYKEAEELKKMTCMLSKHNRLAREAALEEHLARSMRLCEAVLDEREEQEEPSLPMLTEEMLQEIKNALIPRPQDEVLVEGFGLRITRKDVHTLADLNWLNDEVINFYMNLLIARSTHNRYPKVHAMNTFFYPKLITGGHTSLKRWTRKIDIFAQDLLVVPIHLGIHWCMSIIDFRNKSICYYDSMGGNNPKCLSALRQYLEDESLDKKKQTYDTSNWKLECAKNIPQQMNGSDCGVFSCMFAEYICANKKITFTQQDMPYFRNKMVYEILKSKLL